MAERFAPPHDPVGRPGDRYDSVFKNMVENFEAFMRYAEQRLAGAFVEEEQEERLKRIVVDALFEADMARLEARYERIRRRYSHASTHASDARSVAARYEREVGL